MTERKGVGKVLGRAAAGPLNLAVLGGAVNGAAALASWPIAALGGAAYVALIAADVSSAEFRRRVLTGRPAPARLPSPGAIRDPEVRAGRADHRGARRGRSRGQGDAGARPASRHRRDPVDRGARGPPGAARGARRRAVALPGEHRSDRGAARRRGARRPGRADRRSGRPRQLRGGGGRGPRAGGGADRHRRGARAHARPPGAGRARSRRCRASWSGCARSTTRPRTR